MEKELMEDIEGSAYKIVKIGNQVWMSENLNVSHYRNGDPIPQVQDRHEWKELTIGAWCYYKNNLEKGRTCGKLYNWYAVNDPRCLAPEGYHIPSEAEWETLINSLSEDDIAGKKMKSTSGWIDYKGESGNGTNESGFTALPGGYRSFNGEFNTMDGSASSWWSSTDDIDCDAWALSISVYHDDSAVDWFTDEKLAGLSVRCIKDN